MARTIGLDHFYVKISKLILMVQGYTELKYIDKLIKMCRLKPYTELFGAKSKRIELHTWWVDECGNSLHILKNKKLQITPYDLAVDRTKIISTDLYEGLPLNKLYAMSKRIFVWIGYDDKQEKYCAISLLGIDDYLRTFLFIDNVWAPWPSLNLGLQALKTLAGNAKLKNFKEFKYNGIGLPFPCVRQKAWLSCIPVSEEFGKILFNNNLAYVITPNNGEKQ